MAQYYNENGEAVEAFTQEELDQKVEEERLIAIEEANASRQEEIDNIVSELSKKEEELELERKKDKNLSGQRKIIENKEKEIDDLKNKVSEIEKSSIERSNKIESEIRERALINLIDSVSGGDKNLSDKIRFYYDNFKGEPKDIKEQQERIENAFVLATGGKPNNPITGSVISASGYAPRIQSTGKLSEGAENVARQLGITDAEMKKHKLI